jgi:hypothetical protein
MNVSGPSIMVAEILRPLEKEPNAVS